MRGVSLAPVMVSLAPAAAAAATGAAVALTACRRNAELSPLVVCASAAMAGAALSIAVSRLFSAQEVPPSPSGCLVGVLGGMGPKAGSQFFDGGLTAGRVQLWSAMTSATSEGADCPAVARLAAVRALSSAPWSSAEVESVWGATSAAGKLDDEHHVPVLLLSPTQIPSRPRFLEGTCPEDPTLELVRAARVLVRSGATVLCIVCNTAHFFWPAMLAALRRDAAAAGGPPLPRFLHMPELALESAARRRKRLGSSSVVVVGVLATGAALNHGVFHSAAARLNESGRLPEGLAIEIVTPGSIAESHGGSQAVIYEVIFGAKGLKTGYDSLGTAEGRANFEALVDQLRRLAQAGAEAVVLGCTELPLLLTESRLREQCIDDPLVKGLVLVNPTQVLADHALWAGLTELHRR